MFHVKLLVESATVLPRSSNQNITLQPDVIDLNKQRLPMFHVKPSIRAKFAKQTHALVHSMIVRGFPTRFHVDRVSRGTTVVVIYVMNND